jgi:hypothetical protein
MRFAADPDAIYRYTLSAADALVWERLPRPLTGLHKLGFAAVLAVGCGGFALLPHRWVEGWKFFAWLTMVALFAYIGTRLMFDVIALYRARQRYPAPADITLEDWEDHLQFRAAGTTNRIRLGDIDSLARTGDYVFLEASRQLVILPKQAFPPGRLEALAQRIRIAMREEHLSPRPASRLTRGPEAPNSGQ